MYDIVFLHHAPEAIRAHSHTTALVALTECSAARVCRLTRRRRFQPVDQSVREVMVPCHALSLSDA